MLGHGASFTAAAAPSGALPGPVCRDTRASITRGSLRLDSPRPAPSPFRLPLPLRERAGVRGSDARGATSLRGRARVSCGGLRPPHPHPGRARCAALAHPPTLGFSSMWGRSPHAPVRIGSRNTARGRSPARCGGEAPTPPPGSPADRRETVRRPLPSRERAGGEGRRAPARPARAGDDRRTRWLESRGCGVLRFWNDDVLLRLTPVLEAIAGTPRDLRNPPRQGRGDRRALRAIQPPVRVPSRLSTQLLRRRGRREAPHPLSQRPAAP